VDAGSLIGLLRLTMACFNLLAPSSLELEKESSDSVAGIDRALGQKVGHGTSVALPYQHANAAQGRIPRNERVALPEVVLKDRSGTAAPVAWLGGADRFIVWVWHSAHLTTSASHPRERSERRVRTRVMRFTHETGSA